MNVIHRTTLRYLTSVNEPDYPEPAWKWGPDMSQVTGVSPLYWKWDAVNERPIPMTQAEQDAVDAAILTAQRDSAVAQFGSVENGMRAFLLVLLDELNLHSTKQSEELADIAAATSLSDYKTRRAARAAVPQRTEQQLRTAIRSKLGS
jgi:hypothetical protein